MRLTKLCDKCMILVYILFPPTSQPLLPWVTRGYPLVPLRPPPLTPRTRELDLDPPSISLWSQTSYRLKKQSFKFKLRLRVSLRLKDST